MICSSIPPGGRRTLTSHSSLPVCQALLGPSCLVMDTTRVMAAGRRSMRPHCSLFPRGGGLPRQEGEVEGIHLEDRPISQLAGFPSWRPALMGLGWTSQALCWVLVGLFPVPHPCRGACLCEARGHCWVSGTCGHHPGRPQLVHVGRGSWRVAVARTPLGALCPVPCRVPSARLCMARYSGCPSA